MKKTITQIVCVGIFLVAALVFGQKMLVKGQSATSKQADVHSASPDRAVAGGYSRNGPGVSSEMQLADITGDINNPSVENDVAVVAPSQDSADEGENSYIGNDFANDHIYGDGETIEGFGHGRTSAGHTSAGTGVGGGGGGHAGRKMARNPGSRNGGGYFPGGGGGGSGANPGRQSDSGQSSEDTEPSRNGEREDGIPVLASREPAESEGTGEHKSSGNSPEKETETAGLGTNQGLNDDKEDGPDKVVDNTGDGGSGSADSNSPSDVEDSSPEFYDGPPDCVSCDSGASPTKDADNPDYPPIDGSSGESSEAVASAVPEPASVLLTGLGSILLLWMQRRGN